MDTNTHVIVAEDSDAFFDGLLVVLGLDHRVAVVGRVTHKSQLRAEFGAHRPDLIVLDFELADGNVLDLLEDRVIPPELCVILTAFPSAALETQLLGLGVAGFFDKAEIGPFISWLQERLDMPSAAA